VARARQQTQAHGEGGWGPADLNAWGPERRGKGANGVFRGVLLGGWLEYGKGIRGVKTDRKTRIQNNVDQPQATEDEKISVAEGCTVVEREKKQRETKKKANAGNKTREKRGPSADS